MDPHDTAGPTVHITVEGGVVQHVAVPLGVRVVVRDYDVDDSETDLSADRNGNHYLEAVWD